MGDELGFCSRHGRYSSDKCLRCNAGKATVPPPVPPQPGDTTINYCAFHGIFMGATCHNCVANPLLDTFKFLDVPLTPPTTAAKNDKEKPDLSLIPKEALEAGARAFMVGEKKYGRYNYYKGHKVSQLIAAMIRHATAYMDGEELDPVDGQPHLGSVIACAAMLIKQKILGTLIDDRYKPEAK